MLHTHELFNMNVPAEMVVLSACNTRLGNLEEREGVMGVALGFSYAGCPSVVMSHCNANSLAASKLMSLFYTHLANGVEKHVVLQKVKLDFLENANELDANPFHLGNFVVGGDTMALTSRWFLLSGGPIFLWILLIVTVGFVSVKYTAIRN